MAMIFDRLAHVALYRGVHERLGAGLAWLAAADPASLTAGRHEIDGDRLFALVNDFDTKLPGQGFLEAHRRYIDIQCVLRGEERIGYAPLEKLTARPYDEAKDFMRLDGPADFLHLCPGSFAVFFPHDAHMPGIALDRPAAVRKVVVKVAMPA
jgi:YhcH/YjgK/YiaL family protein